MKPLEFVNVFGKFCQSMQVDFLPTERIDQYNEALLGFTKSVLESAFKEWAMNHPPKFMPAPNDLVNLAIEINEREDTKSGPRTVRDMFGNRIRTETPLAKELRGILKQLIGTPTTKRGKVLACGDIDGKQAMKLVTEAEAKHGQASGESRPRRLSVSECLKASGMDETLAIKARKKRDAHMDYKMGESEKAELRKITRFLLPNGHFITRAKDDRLEVESMDEDAWGDSFGILKDMAEGL